MNDILSQIIAYAPNKIDTETKARSMVQGPRNMYNQGQLVQPNVDGSRPGYSGDERKPLNKKQLKLLKEYKKYSTGNIDVTDPKVKSKIRLGTVNEDTIKWMKDHDQWEYSDPRTRYNTLSKKWEKNVSKTVDGKKINKWISQKSDETKPQFFKRIKDSSSKKISSSAQKQAKLTKQTQSYMDNWATDWLDNNLESYGVRDFDKMSKTFAKDWQSHLKKIDLPKGFLRGLSTQEGLPNLAGRGTGRGATRIPFTYEGFELYTGGDRLSDQFKKMFYKNKIRTTPGLKKDLKTYFDFITRDKRGMYNQPGGQTIKAYKDIVNKDVIYLLSPDAEIGGTPKYQLFNSFDKDFNKSYNSYSRKVYNSSQWKENANLIEKKLGLKKNYIQNSMNKEGKNLAKIFDVKQLPPELRYTLEHAQGIGAAAKSGNKEIMERAVNDLIGTTVKQNQALGWHGGGFEANRNAIMREITAGRNVESNIKSLNQLAKDAYTKFGLKGNMYSIKDGQLTSKPISTALTQEDRFGQYFKEIAKTKEGSAAIKEQAGSLKNLLAQLGCPKSLQKASGGRIKFSAGSTCAIKGREVLEKGLKNGFKNADDAVLARGILKTGRVLKDAASLRGLFGPLALGFTVAAEAGFVGYDMLSSGKSFREAVGDSVFNYALGDKTKIDSEEEIIKRLQNIKTGPSGLRDFSDEEIGKMQYFKENLKDIDKGFDLYNQLENVDQAILDNKASQDGTQMFPDNAFQLEAQKDKIQADIQDYNRTNTPNRLTDYMLSPDAQKGADALAKADLLVEQDRLQDAGIGNIYQSRLGDEKRLNRLNDLKFQLEQMYNPTEFTGYENFTPSEMSYIMSNIKNEPSNNYGLFGPARFMEGGIASLNVKK